MISKLQVGFGNSHTKSYEEELFDGMARVYEILRQHVPTSVEATPSSTESVNGINQDETEFKTEKTYHKYEKFVTESIRQPLPIRKSALKHNFRNIMKISPRNKGRIKANVDKHFKDLRPVHRHVSREFKKRKWWVLGNQRGSLRSVNSAMNGKRLLRAEKAQRRQWHSKGKGKKADGRKKAAVRKEADRREMYDQMMPKEFHKRKVKTQKTSVEAEITSTAVDSLVKLESTKDYISDNKTSTPVFVNQTWALLVKGAIESNVLVASPEELKALQKQEKNIENISRDKLVSKSKRNPYTKSLNKVEGRVKHDILSENLDDLKENVQSQSGSSMFWKSPYFIWILSGFVVLMVPILLVVFVCVAVKKSAAYAKKRKNQSSSMLTKRESSAISEYLGDSENDPETELGSVDTDRSLNQEIFRTKNGSFGLETIMEESPRDYHKRNSVEDGRSGFEGRKIPNRKSNLNPCEKLKKLHKNAKLRQQREMVSDPTSLAEIILCDKSERYEEIKKPIMLNNEIRNHLFNPEESQGISSNSGNAKNRPIPSHEKLIEMLLYLDKNPVESPLDHHDIKQTIIEMLALNEPVDESPEHTPLSHRETNKGPKMLLSRYKKV